MKAALRNFINDIGKKKNFWVPVALLTIIAYGFSATNRTVSVDNLATDIYFGSGNAMLAGMRWGMLLWAKICATWIFMPFLQKFIGVCFLACGASILACVFYDLRRGGSVWSYAIFTSAMITYPLINEISEYGAILVVGGNVFLGAVTILFIVTSQKKGWQKILVSALPLTIIVSSYESCAFFYISAVCIYIFCKHIIIKDARSRFQWIKEGISFAIPLIFAVVLRVLIGVFLIRMFGLEYTSNGATTISWGTDNIRAIIGSLINTTITMYGIDALLYFPLTIFVIAAIIFVIGIVVLAIRQKRFLPIILGVIVLVSLFFQSIIQGTVMPYRTAQTLSLFTAFVLAYIVELGLTAKNKGIRLVPLMVVLCLCAHQSIYLHRILALNNQRSDNEIAVVHQLGYRLESEFDHKTIVFVGKYDIGRWISSQIKPDTNTIGGRIYKFIWNNINDEFDVENEEFVDTNVNSLLNWASGAFESQKMMREVFSYCGYDIQVLDVFSQDDRNRYEQIAIERGMRPFEIADIGECILVCLGNISVQK